MSAADQGRSIQTVRNTFIMLASQLTTWSLTIAAMLVVPAYLGPEGFGKLFFAYSFSALLAIAVDLGLDTYLLKEVPRRDGDAARLLGNALALKAALFTVVFAAGIALLKLLGYDSETMWVVGISLVSIWSYGWIKSLTSVFQSFDRYAPPNLALVAEKLVFTLGAIAVLTTGIAGTHGAIWISGVFLVSTLVNLGWCLRSMRGLVPIRLSLQPAACRELVVGCMPFLIWAVFSQIYLYINGTLLSIMTRDEVLGWYGVSVKLYGTLLFLPYIFTSVLIPALSRSYVGSPDAFQRAGRKAFELLLVIAVPMTVGLVLCADRVIDLLYGAEQFGRSAGSLRILAVGLVPIYLSMILGSVIIAMDRQKQWAKASVVAACLNVGLNLGLIPLFDRLTGDGGLGAASATAVTEFFMLAYFIRLLPAGYLGRGTIATAARTLVAAGAMACAVLAAWKLPLPAVMGLGALVYAAAALALGTVSRADMALALSAVRRKSAAGTTPAPAEAPVG